MNNDFYANMDLSSLLAYIHAPFRSDKRKKKSRLVRLEFSPLRNCWSILYIFYILTIMMNSTLKRPIKVMCAPWSTPKAPVLRCLMCSFAPVLPPPNWNGKKTFFIIDTMHKRWRVLYM